MDITDPEFIAMQAGAVKFNGQKWMKTKSNGGIVKIKNGDNHVATVHCEDYEAVAEYLCAVSPENVRQLIIMVMRQRKRIAELEDMVAVPYELMDPRHIHEMRNSLCRLELKIEAMKNPAF